MSATRIGPGPNPLVISMGTLVALVGLIIGAVVVFGDPRAGSPVVVKSLFQKAPAHAVGLKKTADGEVAVVDSDPIPLDAEILDLSQPGALEAYTAHDDHDGHPVVRTAAASTSLPKAPIVGMFQQGPNGPLPIISPDGRTPMQVYARPFSNPENKPMVALWIGGLGLNSATTNAAINSLPPEVTLSFVPYAKDLQSWVDKARAAGHEVMLELPLEPFDYPDNDTGPQTLLANGKAEDNNKKINWLLSRAQGYFAVVNYQGGKFVTATAASGALMQSVSTRGLAFLQDGSSSKAAFAAAARGAQTPFAGADRVVDSNPAAASIDDQLLTMEALALQNGNSLGAGFAYPLTIEKTASWARGLSAKGYALAPVSAVVKTRNAH